MNCGGHWTNASWLSLHRRSAGARAAGSALLALMLASLLGSAQAAPYSVIDLGTLGGTPPNSSAHAINNAGKVVGVSRSPSTAQAFLNDLTGMYNLGDLWVGGDLSNALGINDAGQVVGYAYDSTTYGHAFLRSNGVMHNLGTLGGKQSTACAINARGQVVGDAQLVQSLYPVFDLDGPYHAFLYSDGVMHDLGFNGIANDINDDGQVVGNAYGGADSRAFLWENGAIRYLGPLPAGTSSQASAINASGHVVGWTYPTSWRGPVPAHAFFYDGTGMHDLGTLGGTWSYARDINASGQIVGSSLTSGSSFADRRAFLYSHGVMVDLNSLIPPGTGWVLQDAKSINDAGQIVGEGNLNGQEPRAFLLTPGIDPRSLPPRSPSGLAVRQASTTTVDLVWTDNSNNEHWFELQIRSPMGIWHPFATTATPNVTAYAVGGLTPFNTYLFRVRAVNSVGASDWSNLAWADSIDPPAAPTGLRLAVASASQINLTWSDNSSNERDFEVWRKTGASAYTRIAVLPANSAGYADQGLSGATGYTYRVRATRNEGASAWTHEATATTLTPTPPASPANLAVLVVSVTQLNLTWTDRSTDETGFELQRRTVTGDWAQIALLPANSTRYSDIGLVPLSTYIYRVRSVNAVGPSTGWSNEAWADTVVPPAAPTNLQIRVASIDQIVFSWTDNSADERAFEVWRRIGSSDWTRIASLPANSTLFSDGTVLPGTSYYYRVRAISRGGASAWTNEISWTAPELR